MLKKILKIISIVALSMIVVATMLVSSYFLGLFCTSEYHENERHKQSEELKEAMTSHHEAMRDLPDIMQFEPYWNRIYKCDRCPYESIL